MSFGPMDGWSWTVGGGETPEYTGAVKAYRIWEMARKRQVRRKLIRLYGWFLTLMGF